MYFGPQWHRFKNNIYNTNNSDGHVIEDVISDEVCVWCVTQVLLTVERCPLCHSADADYRTLAEMSIHIHGINDMTLQARRHSV